jgi:hypothetical protein
VSRIKAKNLLNRYRELFVASEGTLQVLDQSAHNRRGLVEALNTQK